MTTNTELIARAKAVSDDFEEYWGSGAPVDAGRGKVFHLIGELSVALERANTALATLAKVREYVDDLEGRNTLGICTALRAILDAHESGESEHGPDWSDWGEDHPEEGPSCKCGYNGTPEECAESRLAITEAREREALEDLITDRRDEYPRDPHDMPSADLTDAILAAGFRRAPIEDAEPVGYVDRDGDFWAVRRDGLFYKESRMPRSVAATEEKHGPLMPVYRHPSAPIEVTDEALVTAMNVANGYEPPVTDIAYWSEGYRENIRAGIEAALREMGKSNG